MKIIYRALFRILYPGWPYTPSTYGKMNHHRYRLMHKLYRKSHF